MFGWSLSLGRADRLGQPRLSEAAQPYLKWVRSILSGFRSPLGVGLSYPLTANRLPLLGGMALAIPPNTTNRVLIRLALKVVGS